MENQPTNHEIPRKTTENEGEGLNSVDMLSLPNVRDIDSGVSSGSSTPTYNTSSRRSSTYSEQDVDATINHAIQPKCYFRQVSFDEDFEKYDSQNTFPENRTQCISSEHTKYNTSFTSARDYKNTPSKNRIESRQGLKKNDGKKLKNAKSKESRSKLVRRRRKSLATSSKEGLMFQYLHYTSAKSKKL